MFWSAPENYFRGGYYRSMTQILTLPAEVTA